MQKLGPFLVAVLVLALEPLAEHALQSVTSGKPALPCECIGSRDARMNIVYLHGRDTFGPSWIEVRNRQKLRAIAEILHARIALPRTRGSWLSRGQLVPAIVQVKAAANTCFANPHSFVILGFSDGANAANELFFECRTDISSEIVSVGSSKGGRRGCGHLALIAGRHEAGFSTTKLLARQLARRGADVQFYEHAGPHEIPVVETVAALRQVHR